MFDRIDDTIVAVSSPPGFGVRGILRISGPQAFHLASEVFAGEDHEALHLKAGHGRYLGRLRVDRHGSVPAEACTFRAPSSYTRQDVVELHTIGSPAVLAIVLDQLVHAGARLAEPGEFTARAFFSGAMDLTRVEGVAAMIHAANDAQLRASEALLHGALSRRTLVLRERLVDLLSMIEAQIDFAEEPIEFVSADETSRTIRDIERQLHELSDDAPSVERLATLPEVLIVGLPNAGKSTLFNRLSGTNRAIQSALPRTTRDVLRCPATLPAGEIMLCDSAGIASLAGQAVSHAEVHLDDQAEQRVRRAIARADLILVVIDVSDEPVSALSALAPRLPRGSILLVVNKIDKPGSLDTVPALRAHLAGRAAVFISGLTGKGVDELRESVGRTLFASATSRSAGELALSQRQRAAITDALAALARAGALCRGKDAFSSQAEILALELREAVSALSSLTGDVTTEELLGRVFSRFCIGK